MKSKAMIRGVNDEGVRRFLLLYALGIQNRECGGYNASYKRQRLFGERRAEKRYGQRTKSACGLNPLEPPLSIISKIYLDIPAAKRKKRYQIMDESEKKTAELFCMFIKEREERLKLKLQSKSVFGSSEPELLKLMEPSWTKKKHHARDSENTVISVEGESTCENSANTITNPSDQVSETSDTSAEKSFADKACSIDDDEVSATWSAVRRKYGIISFSDEPSSDDMAQRIAIEILRAGNDACTGGTDRSATGVDELRIDNDRGLNCEARVPGPVSHGANEMATDASAKEDDEPKCDNLLAQPKTSSALTEQQHRVLREKRKKQKTC